MSGFELIDMPESGLGQSPNTISSLMQLLTDDENELQEEGEGTSVPGSQRREAPLDQLNGQSGEQDPELPDEHSEHDETKYRVRVNGEEMEVTLNELREGFQLKSDYTRKAQDLAASRHEIEQRAQVIEQERQRYSNLLDAMKERYESLIPAEPDWAALAQSDPVQYTRQRAAWDSLQKQMGQVEQERQRVRQEQGGQQQQQYRAYLEAQRAAMLKARPDLAEPEKWNDYFSTHNSYAVNELGFTPQEAQSFTDHRVFLLLEKARKYDALQNPGLNAGRGNGAAPKPTIPNLAPGSKTRETASSATSRKAKQQLARTGSTQDAAAAILGSL